MMKGRLRRSLPAISQRRNAQRVGIPQHLSELGIKESDLDKLATAAIADVCTPGNPREVSKEIILDLYKQAL